MPEKRRQGLGVVLPVAEGVAAGAAAGAGAAGAAGDEEELSVEEAGLELPDLPSDSPPFFT